MDFTATEDILRNPAALHSLKRDQLIRLCKIHGVKASGKNVDIAERLANIPLQAKQQAPQPQLVTIKEDTVTSTGTTKTGSDFGSVKSSLSLKSIVSSFGFTSRKTTSTPPTSISTTATSLPSTISSQVSYAASIPLPPSPPPPLIIPFTPPSNIDTVRLVTAPRPSVGGTPMLPAFKTTFDLVLGTPAKFADASVKAARHKMVAEKDEEEKKEGIEKIEAAEVEKELVGNPQKSENEESVPEQNDRVSVPQTPSRSKLPTPVPAFTFGSPAPHIFRPRLSSNVKASVFEEMMRRAAGESDAAGDDTFVLVGKPATPTGPNRPTRPLPRKSLRTSGPPPLPPFKSPAPTISGRFDKVHEATFKRMAGINEPRGGAKRKVEADPSINDRRVSTKLAPKACAGRPSVIGANGVRRTSGVHGGRRSSIRPRTSAVGGRRISIGPPPPPPSRKGFNFGFSGLKGLFFGKKKEELEADSKPAALTSNFAVKKREPEKGKKPGLTGLGLGKVAATTATTQSTVMAAPSRKVSAPINSNSSFVPTDRKVSAPSTSSVSSTKVMGPPTTTTQRKVSMSTTSKAGPSSALRPRTTTASSVTTRGSLSSTTRGSISGTTAQASASTRNSSLSSTTRTSTARTPSINSAARTSSISSGTRLSSVASNTRSSTARGSLSSTAALAPASTRNSSLTSTTRSSIGRPSVTSTRPLRPSAVSVSRQTKPTSARGEKENVPLRGVPEKAEPDLQDGEQGIVPKKIFSQPLTVPSEPLKGTLNRSLSGRKPRISRTTVVARLAARRAGPTTALSSAGSRRSLVGGDGGGRVRSSFGTGGKANVLGINGGPRKSMPGKRGSMQLGKGGTRKSVPGKRPSMRIPV